ncbi:MAG: ABC transporter permease, partial [Casimicrobiaceae bacterium]
GMIIGQLVFVFPCVALVLIGPWRTLDPRYAQSAAALRAAPCRVLSRVKLPLLAHAIGVACAVGMAASIALYLPTHLIDPGTVTALVNAVASNPHAITSRATALDASLLALLPIALVAIALHRRRRLVPTPIAWQSTGR